MAKSRPRYPFLGHELDSEFKLTKAERFSYKYKVGEYYSYKDSIVIWVEWKCDPNAKFGFCDVGGANFRLVDLNDNYTNKAPVLSYELPPSVSLPKDAISCCGRAKAGDKIIVYIPWNVNHSCSHDWTIKYQRLLSASGPIYYLELPDSVQCSE